MPFDLAALTKSAPLFFDGGTGTVLQAQGLTAGERPELWNLCHPERIVRLHRDYLEAGAQLIKTNTFGANRLKFPKGGSVSLEDVITAALDHAKLARKNAGRETDAWIALDLGPSGKLLEPLGDLAFEEAVSLFRESAAIGAAQGADCILIETMIDGYEAKAAILGAKEAAPELPVLCTLTFEENGRLLTGADPAACAVLLESLGVCALGINCGAGPARAERVLPQILAATHLPVIVNPNAGLPQVREGKTYFDLSPEAFAAQMERLHALGASLFGGCCGTTPAHIQALTQRLAGKAPKPPQAPRLPVICSQTQLLRFGEVPALIGERLNPTGKPALQTALREEDWDYLQEEAAQQRDAGAHALDLNVGLPGIPEGETMLLAMEAVETCSSLPLQIDSANPEVLAAALRRAKGKVLVNSVNGKQASMHAVFPLLKKYGGVAVALLLDEGGIPKSVEGRLAVAEKIYAAAAQYGLGKEDILIDALTLTVSAEPDAALVTLETLRQIKARFGGYTILGVSNISFGLPHRALVNAAFFTLALQAGLDAAIMNPKSEAMMSAYRSYMLLSQRDPSCADYLAHAAALPKPQTAPVSQPQVTLRDTATACASP
ncbi:MAG: homocysteine S-methyltransferase family protein [Oscillospiraceae bacterium]|jgi:5-methyltetrahydrofolate--homocysteine methyltransferase|nr:homocysteine S-methyltransferase family protein [Oscillospiraceae bacterium]